MVVSKWLLTRTRPDGVQVKVRGCDHYDSYAQGNHSADMLMVYLPKEKILINADLYSPPVQGAPTPTPTAGMRTLYQNMRKQNLDVAQHVCPFTDASEAMMTS